VNVLEVGKLYKSEEFYLFLYPDQAAAYTVWFDSITHNPPSSITEHHEFALKRVSYWSKELSKTINFISARTPFLVLSMDRVLIEVLVENKKGWIFGNSLLKIKEVC
jgi:hypothetical protein